MADVGELTISLGATLTLSRPLPEEARGLVGELVKRANEGVFMRGAAAGKAKIKTEVKRWEAKANTLTVDIVSGTYARAPAALLRLRKMLAEELGQRYKLGIRGLQVERLEVAIPRARVSSPPQLVERVKALEFVGDAAFDESSSTLHLRLNPLTESELKRNIPDRVIGLVEGMVAEAISREAHPKAQAAPVVKVGSPKPVRFREEPARVALELGWVKEFPGRGQWIYTTPYAKLLEVIEDILLEEMILKLDFQPFMLPKLIPIEVMRKMPGYLEDIPEGMYYVCHPPRDPEAFSRFKQVVKVTKRVPKDLLKEIILEPNYVLAPAQCEPFWQFFSHETVKLEELPIKLYDRSGWTYRWEGGGVEGLTRIQEFRRIELGYLGSPEQVVETRDTLRDNIVRIVDEVLDLDWRVVAAAPFYMKEREVGDVSESRNVAAYDVEVYLPYRGEREKAEWLEIAACFIHKTKFVDSFSIHEAKNRPIWTGCCGLGISRWVAAFLATHGFKPEAWPDRVRERFGGYRLPRLLLWPKTAAEGQG